MAPTEGWKETKKETKWPARAKEKREAEKYRDMI